MYVNDVHVWCVSAGLAVTCRCVMSLSTSPATVGTWDVPGTPSCAPLGLCWRGTPACRGGKGPVLPHVWGCGLTDLKGEEFPVRVLSDDPLQNVSMS